MENLNYMEKYEEYKSLLDWDNEDYKKDFKNNLRFVTQLMKREEKKNKNNSNDEWKIELYKFFVVLIKIHKETYMREGL